MQAELPNTRLQMGLFTRAFGSIAGGLCIGRERRKFLFTLLAACLCTFSTVANLSNPILSYLTFIARRGSRVRALSARKTAADRSESASQNSTSAGTKPKAAEPQTNSAHHIAASHPTAPSSLSTTTTKKRIRHLATTSDTGASQASDSWAPVPQEPLTKKKTPPARIVEGDKRGDSTLKVSTTL